MGPMGPMGPIMGNGSWGDSTVGSVVVVAALLGLVLGVVVLALASRSQGRVADTRSPPSPREILRERYARGDITRQQYVDALVDVLKDRCIRGELTVEEYEARLDLLLREPFGGVQQESERRERPLPRR